VAGIKRIFVLAVILGAAIHLWFYNEVIVSTFFEIPASLAAQIVGTFDYIQIVDSILASGFDAATLLIRRGSVFNDHFIFYVTGVAVYAAVLTMSVYTMFLLILSRIALSVLLALGPLFISLLFFETTKKFFESWIAQLANYALITILTILVAMLLMTFVLGTVRAATAVGGEIEVMDALRLVLAAVLTLLVMRQVMPMAAGLASGLALSTFGLVSNAMRWGMGGSLRTLGRFGRGLTDQQTTRWDPLSRKAGYYVRRAVMGAPQVARRLRRNSVRQV
jgi:type IV secretion system protein VirB6